MRLYVSHPRLLAVIGVLLAGAAATLTFAYSDDQPVQDVLVPADNDAVPPDVSPEESAAAKLALSNNEHLRKITGAVAWVADGERPAMRLEQAQARAPREVGAGYDLRLDEPVTSDGPWLSLRCRGTRQVSQSVLWVGVSSLRVTVSNEGQLIEITPAPQRNAETGQFERPGDYDAKAPVKTLITDLLTGKTVWESSDRSALADAAPHMTCPRGFDDD